MEVKRKSETREEFEKRISNPGFANCGPLPTEDTLNELDEVYYTDKQANKEKEELPGGEEVGLSG